MVGTDSDLSMAGNETAHPGPMNNIVLFEGSNLIETNLFASLHRQ